MNLATLIDDHGADRPALISAGTVTTYGELRDQVARIRGSLLARGVEPGDRIAIVADNNWSFVAAYLATLGVGAVAVPLNPQSPAPELERELGLVDAELVLVGPEPDQVTSAGHAASSLPGCQGHVRVVDLLDGEPAALVEREADDLAVLLYTSGTVGRPRPAMLSHGNLVSNIEQILANPDRPPDIDEVALGVLPLFHVFGLNALLGLTMHVGGTLVLVERFDARATLDLVAEHGVAVLSGVPTMWAAWVNVPDVGPEELSTVRLGVSGAAALDPDVRRAVRERFGIDIIEGYGLTEAAPAVTSGLGCAAPDGSIGVPLPGVSVRLVEASGEDALVGDPGEIWVKGPNVFGGYWHDPEATEAALTPDGWLRTGDIAVVDDDGYLSLVDRAKDLIIVSGFNVYPGEVEEVLAQHPSVEAAAVVPEPHPRSGEAVKAFVVREPGADVDEAELIEHAGRHLARYKCPSSITFVDELPYSVTGKVVRRSLR